MNFHVNAEGIVGKLQAVEARIAETGFDKLLHHLVKLRASLTSVCTRRALDVMKSASYTRADYVGHWLPEPMETGESRIPEIDLMVSESVTMAFLLVLERLAPKERAAFVLHDVFAMDYAEIAGQLGIAETACRKLVSRARANVTSAGNTKPAPKALQKRPVDAFRAALLTGSTVDLAGLLTIDAVLTADSGGKAVSIRGPITHAVVSFNVNADSQIAEIMIMRNPDKLRGFDLLD